MACRTPQAPRPAGDSQRAMRPVAPLHPQLNAIADEFATAQMRLHRLVEVVPVSKWGQRPAPDHWSVAECVAHLNLTAEAFRAPVTAALDAGRAYPRASTRRYRRGFVGWLLWRSMGPPVRVRMKTAAPFIPQAMSPVEEIVSEFDRRQDEQLGWVWTANGLPLERLMIVSPFNSKVRYNLYACLSILPRHQHRHLWQAEEAWKASVRSRRVAAEQAS